MHPLNPDIPDSFPTRAVFQRPAVRLLVAVASGVLIASLPGYRFGLWMAGLGLVCIGLALWLRRSARRSEHAQPLLLLSALVFASASWTVLRIGHAPADSVIHLLSDEPSILRIEAEVIDQPRLATQSGALAETARYAPPSIRMRLDVRRVQHADGRWVRASGGLYGAVSNAGAPSFHAGDTVRLIGTASRLRQPGNPGAHDPHPSAMQRGIVGSIRVSDPNLVSVVSSRRGPIAATTRLRAEMLERIEAAGERTGRAGSAALLGALLLGDRESQALAPLEDSFTRTGVGHFLAISGLHVGMVLVGLALLVRLTGDRPRLEFAVVVGASVLLLLFIPARPPVLRAVLIALAFILAQASGRSYDRLSVLALVATGMLIARPIDLFNPGFQLTFLVVAGLIVCAQPLRIWMFGARPATDELRGWSVAEHRVKDAAAVSVCASAVSTPLIAWHFGVFSALAAPLSVLLSPLVALTLGIGYAALTLGAVLPGIADDLISLALQPAAWLADVVGWFDMLPGIAMYLPAISWGLALAMIAVTLWWMFPSYTSERRRWIATGVVLLPVAYGVAIGPSLGRGESLRIDMLDVGDGTTILLRSGRDAMLYDCGSRWLGVGEREIPRAVRALGAGRVSTVVV
jgi:competence protein ComEC